MRKLTILLVVISISAALFLFSGCGDNGNENTSPAVDQSTPAQTQSTGTTAAAGTGPSQTASGGAGQCPVVDGQQAALALGGTYVDSKEIANPPANQVHCTLTVDIGGAPKVFVIWQMPAEDFDDLKAAEEDPKTDVSGVGEKAYITFHPDTQRYDMAAAKMGKFTVQVTGDDEEQVKKVVSLIISQY